MGTLADTPDLPDQEQAIPLGNVSSSVMAKVLEYCTHHKNDPLPGPDTEQDETRRRVTEISEWDAK